MKKQAMAFDKRFPSHIDLRLAEAEEKLEGLKEEIQSIKSWALEIEEENQRLRAELFALSSVKPMYKGAGRAETGPAESGHATLERLYREEFHICPYNFGQRRTEGCLFCLGFLEKLVAR